MRPGDAGHAAVSGAPDDDDAVVITRSLTDPEQFAALYRRHAPVILRYVTRRIGADGADDVVAETFLVAFRQRAAYRTECPDAVPWLYGIATNLVGRHRRTEVRQLRLLARTGVDPVAEPFTDRVDAAVSAASMNAQLAGVLARLPAAQRDALLLVAWGGLSYDQVAAATGAPLGTVQSRISRARKRLRRSLAEPDLARSGPPRTLPAAPPRALQASPSEET